MTPITLGQIEEPSSTMAFMLNQATSAYGDGFGCDFNTLEASDYINMLRWRAIYNDGGNIWAYPGMPSASGGYADGPLSLGCP